LFQLAILFVRSIVLARILGPEPFGVYGYAQAIIAITIVIPSFGLGAAYLNRAAETEDRDALAVHFTLTTLFSIAWAGLLLAAARLVSTSSAAWVLSIMVGAALLAQTVKSAQVRLMRLVTFRRVALVDLTIALTTTTAAVFLAFRGMGIWSLLSIDLVAAIVLVAGYYLVKPVWRPRLSLSKPIARYYVNYGRRVVMAQLLGLSNERLDAVWTGRYLGDASLGLYGRAYALATYPVRVVTTPLGGVASSIYAELKGDRSRLSRAFFLFNWLTIRVSFFLAGLLLLIAPDLVILLLGVQWLPMLGAFRVLVVYMMFAPVRYSIMDVFPVIGKPEILVRIQLAQLIVLIPLLYLLGSRLGMEGVALAVGCMIVTGVVLALLRLRDDVDIPLGKLLVSPFAAVGLATVVTLLAGEAVPLHWGLLPRTVVETVGYALVYCVVTIVIEKRQVLEMVDLVKDPIRRQLKRSPLGP